MKQWLDRLSAIEQQEGPHDLHEMSSFYQNPVLLTEKQTEFHIRERLQKVYFQAGNRPQRVVHDPISAYDEPLEYFNVLAKQDYDNSKKFVPITSPEQEEQGWDTSEPSSER